MDILATVAICSPHASLSTEESPFKIFLVPTLNAEILMPWRQLHAWLPSTRCVRPSLHVTSDKKSKFAKSCVQKVRKTHIKGKKYRFFNENFATHWKIVKIALFYTDQAFLTRICYTPF